MLTLDMVIMLQMCEVGNGSRLINESCKLQLHEDVVKSPDAVQRCDASLVNV